MDGLKIETTVFRAESVRDLAKPPQGMRVSRRRPPRIRVQSSELAEDVTQLPTEFRGPRFLRPTKRVEEKIPVFPIISPVCQDDLCCNEGTAKVDNKSMSTVSLEREARHLLEGESRILLSEEDVLHFDLDPR